MIITRALLSLLFIVKRLTLVYLLIILALPPSNNKLGLIKTLIDRAYKLNSNTRGFHNDIKNLSEILKRNIFPRWLIDKSVKGYLSKVRTTGKDTSKCETSNCYFYKLYLISVIILPMLEEKFHILLIHVSIAKT